MNFIFGTAGFAKEVEWLTHDLFEATGTDLRPDYFVAEDGNPLIGSRIASKEVLSESQFFADHCRTVNDCFIAVGSPRIREKIAAKIIEMAPFSRFPNLVHPSCAWDRRPEMIRMGRGNIICANCVLTTNIAIGDFVHVNVGCSLTHDSSFGSFSTISPGARISGNVHIAERVFIGSGASVIERVELCCDAVVGIGSTVTRSITEPGTYFGSPARKIPSIS